MRKMKRILRFDWLPELAHSGSPVLSREKRFCFRCIINPYWPSLLNQDGWVFVPYPAILTSGSVKNAFIHFFLQAMKQRTRAMGFLKTIFEDGVDCILTPGEYVDAGIARERSNARYVIKAFSSSIITVQTAYSWNDHELSGKKLSGVGNQLKNWDGRSLIINDMLSGGKRCFNWILSWQF